jgi:hypothetical protein
MKTRNGGRAYAEALITSITSLQLRLAWDDSLQQDLPRRIQQLVNQSERSWVSH